MASNKKSVADQAEEDKNSEEDDDQLWIPGEGEDLQLDDIDVDEDDTSSGTTTSYGGYRGYAGQSGYNTQDSGSNWGGCDKTVTDLNNLSDREKQELIEQHSDRIEISRLAVDPIQITYEVYEKILATMNAVTSRREWTAMLEVEDDVVVDMFFPEQKGSRTTVKDIDDEACAGYPGIIHSHHTMGASFSGTDHNGINSNYDFSILVAWDNKSKNTLEFQGSRRLGSYNNKIVKEDTAVRTVQPGLDLEDWKETVQERHNSFKYKSKSSKSSKSKSSKSSKSSSSSSRSSKGSYARSGSNSKSGSGMTYLQRQRAKERGAKHQMQIQNTDDIEDN